MNKNSLNDTTCFSAHKNLNKNSIGIELVNRGHQYGYQNYTKKQINKLILLCKHLIKKYKIKRKSHIINIFMPQVVLKSWMPRTYDKLHHTLLKPTNSSSKLLAEYLEILAKYTTDQKKILNTIQWHTRM